MKILVTLTTAGIDSGPFNLFSDVDGYTTAFALGVTKQQLLDGYLSDVVPDGTTIIKVQSVNSLCNNFILLPIGITTTTTTTTASSYQLTVYLGSAYCNSDICYLDGTPSNQIVYLPQGAEPTVGGYLYEDPELTIPFVTSQIISTYFMLLLTFPTGELSLLCMEGSACPE